MEYLSSNQDNIITVSNLANMMQINLPGKLIHDEFTSKDKVTLGYYYTNNTKKTYLERGFLSYYLVKIGSFYVDESNFRCRMALGMV